MTTALLEKTHDPKTHLITGQGVAGLFGVSVRELARAIGESENTAKRPSPKLQPKLTRLVYAYQQLQTVFPDDATIPKWLRHPLKSLGGLTPLGLLEKHGLESFVALADEVADGTYA